MLVTYTHRDDPNGARFRQHMDVSLPEWAVNATCDYTDVRELADKLRLLEASLHERRDFVAIGVRFFS